MLEQTKNAILWIDELETTKEKQATGKLGSDEIGYCCMGFGCKLLEIDYRPLGAFSDDFESKIGLHSPGAQECAILNDTKDLTFNQIALKLINNPNNFFSSKVAKELKNHYKHHKSVNHEVN